MKAWGWLLAVVPFVVPGASTTMRPPQQGALAIAVDVRAPIGWGSVEWHLLTREPKPGWHRVRRGVLFARRTERMRRSGDSRSRRDG